MRIQACQEEALQEHLFAEAGSQGGANGSLVEAVRSELMARRVTTRTSLARAIQRRLAPVMDVRKEEVTGILDDMTQEGDLSSGTGGRIAAAPLRMVVLTDRCWAVHGTLPTAKLAVAMPGSTIADGVRRFAEADATNAEVIREAVLQLEGLELSLERWAGIDRTPAADDAWLSWMDDRLARQGEALSPDDAGGDWRCYRPGPAVPNQRQRWVKAQGETRASLWRTWDERGWYIFMWSDGNTPSAGKSMRLARDEATRTMFALDRQAEAPLAFSYSKTEEGVQIVFDAFLPRAEFRYLAAVSARPDGDEPGAYTVRRELWENLMQTLACRLAVEFSSEKDPE